MREEFARHVDASGREPAEIAEDLIADIAAAVQTARNG
jgi:hypothetical protein